MSYDINLTDPVTGSTIELDFVHQMKGGTYQVGGSKEASLNVTWNYGDRLRRVFGEKGIRTIYGMTGAESIPVLKAAISQLANDTEPTNYWISTDGNTKAALVQLLALAQLRPDGIWYGD